MQHNSLLSDVITDNTTVLNADSTNCVQSSQILNVKLTVVTFAQIQQSNNNENFNEKSTKIWDIVFTCPIIAI
jgi:hypothetical protein